MRRVAIDGVRIETIASLENGRRDAEEFIILTPVSIDPNFSSFPGASISSQSRNIFVSIHFFAVLFIHYSINRCFFFCWFVCLFVFPYLEGRREMENRARTDGGKFVILTSAPIDSKFLKTRKFALVGN